MEVHEIAVLAANSDLVFQEFENREMAVRTVYTDYGITLDKLKKIISKSQNRENTCCNSTVC